MNPEIQKEAEELARAIRFAFAKFLDENPSINLYHSSCEGMDRLNTAALLQFSADQLQEAVEIMEPFAGAKDSKEGYSRILWADFRRAAAFIKKVKGAKE